MLGMMKKHTKAKAGSPAAKLMGHALHRDTGGSVSGSDIGTNTGSSIARAPGADSNFKRGGSTFKARKESMKHCFANGGGVMDTMHGTPGHTSNQDILNTFHGGSSTRARALAAGGAAKTRRDYPNT